jgi:hypothetical protein
MALTAPAGGFAIDLVRDRKIRMKQQLYVSGVRTGEYWISQFITYFMLLLRTFA